MQHLDRTAAKQAVAELLLLHRKVAVDEAGRDLLAEQRGNLLGHECFQRRDHHGRTSPEDRGQLEAQRLARSRGTHDQDRLALKGGLDNRQLAFPEPLHTEKAQPRSEVFGRLVEFVCASEQARETDSPTLDHAARQPAGEHWVMRGVAAVAEGYEIRELVRPTHRSRQQVMNIGVAADLTAAVGTAIIITGVDNPARFRPANSNRLRLSAGDRLFRRQLTPPPRLCWRAISYHRDTAVLYERRAVGVEQNRTRRVLYQNHPAVRNTVYILAPLRR